MKDLSDEQARARRGVWGDSCTEIWDSSGENQDSSIEQMKILPLQNDATMRHK